MAHGNYEHHWLTSAADAAFQQAAAKVIERARQAGASLVIWQDGHVEEIPSDQLLPNVWANALAIEHRAWLRKFDPQYLSNWEKLLGNDCEAALSEAGVRRLLQRQDVVVEPYESLTGDRRRPDFRCRVADDHFYVEATCVQISTAEEKTGVKDCFIGHSSYDVADMNKAIQAKCKNKAKQFRDLDRPALLAICTLHMQAALELSEKTAVNLVLTGIASMAWDVDLQSGQQVGPIRQTTKLEAAACFEPNMTPEIKAARRSVSGLLLCRISAEPPTALGALNPEAVRSFNPALLPGVPFAQLELDRDSSQLTVRWPAIEG